MGGKTQTTLASNILIQ